MGLSSQFGLLRKLLAGACLGFLLIGPGEAAVAARPGLVAAPGARALPRPLPRIIRGGNLGRRVDGRRRGYGYAGLGLAALGLGYGLDAGGGLGADDGAAPPIGPYGPPMLPPPVLPPLPPACPLIIKVGRGLTHAVKTQVVYGRPFCRS